MHTRDQPRGGGGGEGTHVNKKRCCAKPFFEFGIPGTGFDTSLTIMFDHDEPHRKLTANTSSGTFNLPVCDLLTN